MNFNAAGDSLRNPKRTAADWPARKPALAGNLPTVIALILRQRLRSQGEQVEIA
jgi:hypothetical protein